MERQAAKWKVEVELDELGESLSRLRLCDPQQQQAMERSLSKLGQLTSVLANCGEGRLEVIDGFKRLRAARALGWTKLRVEQVEVRSAEAKVCQCNRSRGLSELEEAWVIRAMHRDDNLMQSEIARMFGRHKSWVSRRLLLAEGLCDALQADLRLGLMSASAGRELARLPRGNQEEVGGVVKRRGLTSKQVVGLVDAWRRAPSDEERVTLLERAGQGDAIEPHGFRRHVDLDRARQKQHHSPPFVATSTCASQAGSTFPGSSTSSSSPPLRNTTTGTRPKPVTTTGANDSCSTSPPSRCSFAS